MVHSQLINVLVVMGVAGYCVQVAREKAGFKKTPRHRQQCPGAMYHALTFRGIELFILQTITPLPTPHSLFSVL
jgi:hypothetical protein